MFKRKGGKRSARKGRGRRPKKQARIGNNPATDNRNYATITETYRTVVGGGPATELQANTPYLGQTTIASYPRALAVARCFKFYRLKTVIYEYQPDANTYQAGGTNTETIPFMYYMMNRDGSDQSGLTLAQLQNAGARPIKFTKPITIKYKPNLIKANQLIVSLVPNTSLYNGNNVPVYDEWVSTMGLQHGAPSNWSGETVDLPVQAQGNAANPLVLPDVVNVLPYYGHSFFFNQTVTPQGSATVGYQSVTCIWEFKEPVLYTVGSSVEAPAATV